MKIPAPKRNARPLTYPFNKVVVNEPYTIQLDTKEKIISAGNSARQYAKRNKLKFVIRTDEKSITIYRTK